MRTTFVSPLTAVLVTALFSVGPPAAVAGPAAPAAVTVTSNAASTVAAAKVRLRTTTPTVEVGERARLVGRARAPRGTKVLVQRRTAGSKAFVAAGRTRVRAGGRFRYSERVTSGRDRRYRACVTVRGDRVCSRSVEVEVDARAAVTLVVAGTTPTTLEAGQPVTVAGSASAALVGGAVHLQASYGGVWTTVGTGTVAADSTFAVSGILSTPGRTVPLRVVAPETPTTHEATAAAGAVTVFGWYYFHDGGPLIEVAGNWCPLSRTVAGVAHPRSIGFGFNCNDDNVGEASLAGACTTFAATVGLSDSAEDTTADARYSFTVRTDGALAHHIPEVAPGQAFEVSVPLSGVQRLRLEGPFVSGTKGLLVIGDARAHCAF